MTATPHIFLVALALMGPASLALARGQALEAGEVRAASPVVSGLLRHITATGTTKPNGAVLDGRLGTSPFLEAADRRIDRVVRTAICRGC